MCFHLERRLDPDGRHLGVGLEGGVLNGCGDVERHFRQRAVVCLAADEINDAAIVDAEKLVVIESDLQVGVGFQNVIDITAYTYAVVRELVGHGVGHDMHEEPEVPNYGMRGRGKRLVSGMVIAIEPMINMGRKEVYFENDGWTVRTYDRKPAAHFEHTIAIRKGEADILSGFDFIESVLGDRKI